MTARPAYAYPGAMTDAERLASLEAVVVVMLRNTRAAIGFSPLEYTKVLLEGTKPTITYKAESGNFVVSIE